jgi:hypothetical protein
MYFSPTHVGAPRTRVITINNYLETTYEGFVQAETNSPAFEITGGLGEYQLGHGESHEVQVRFDPKHAGNFHGSVDLGPWQESYALAGMGIEGPYEVTVDQDTLFWDSVFSDHWIPTLDLRFENEGDAQILASVIIEGEGFSSSYSQLSLPPNPGYGPPHMNLDVSFEPDEIGIYRGLLRFEPDIGISIPLEGKCRGLQPHIEFSTYFIPFGYVPLSENRSDSFSITNSYEGQYVGQVTYLDPQATGIYLDPPGPDIFLGPYQDRTFDVAYSPTEGAHQVGLCFSAQSNVTVTAFSRAGPNPFRVGVFFDDTSFQQNEIQAAAGDTVTAYLVGFAPDVYLRGWDACLEVTGDNELLSLDTPGWNPFNFGGGVCNHWRSQTHEHQSGTQVLAVAKILINCDDCSTQFHLYPHPGSIFGVDSVFRIFENLPAPPGPDTDIPWGAVVPVQALPMQGQEVAATINPPSLSIDQPGDAPAVPTATDFKGCFPNPFNPQTTFSFDLAAEAQVKIEIYDLAGRRVRELVHQKFQAGSHDVSWEGCDDQGRRLSSGTYLVRTHLGEEVTQSKVSLLK